MRRAIIGILVVTAMLALSAPALAGGWATVRLDEPPGDVVVNEPWQFGFMVLQHDLHPNSDVTPVVRALHKETGEEVTVTGEQEGPIGHFVAELILPRAGEWKWLVHPEPFAETSFETLTVLLASPYADAYPASILTGSCAALGDIAYSLGDVEPRAMAAKSSPLPVAVGSSTIDMPLPELLETGHAIGISVSESDTSPVACGDLVDTASEVADELVLGLQDTTSTQNVGVAVLRDEGERTAVTLYLLNSGKEGATPPVLGKTMTVEIVDAVFQPHTLEAAVGATVTWVNRSAVAHTVTGDDLAFDDSGLVEPGESFSLTFEEPGMYQYRCGPHPEMTGVIVVT